MKISHEEMLAKEDLIAKKINEGSKLRVSEIASELGVTCAAVYKYLDRARSDGILKTMPGEKRWRRINTKIRIYTKEGRSAKWIAEQLGISLSKVYKERSLLNEKADQKNG